MCSSSRMDSSGFVSDVGTDAAAGADGAVVDGGVVVMVGQMARAGVFGASKPSSSATTTPGTSPSFRSLFYHRWPPKACAAPASQHSADAATIFIFERKLVLVR